MNESPDKSLDIELDLVFNTAPNEISRDCLDGSTQFRLTQSEPWHQDLRNWIHIVRKDKAFRTTVIELSAIKRAANGGESSTPKLGNKTPAAMGKAIKLEQKVRK